MSITARITSKGQMTIPKRIRKYLNSKTVEFEIEEGKVILRPVKNVAGSLKKYARPDFIPKEREGWHDAVSERFKDS